MVNGEWSRVRPLFTDHLSPITGKFRGSKFSGQRLDPAEEILFVGHSCDLVAELAVLKEEQRWNRANVVLVRKTLVLVDVDLRDLDRAGFFFRDLVQKGGDHFAGATPFRPEIDNHWLVALGYFTLKICLVEIDRYRILHYPK
jgi:hypothetical protein